MDITVPNPRFNAEYPKLKFSSPYKNKRFLGNTYLTPIVKSEYYTAKFLGAIEFEEDSLLLRPELKSFSYKILRGNREKGELWFSQAWYPQYATIKPSGCSFGVDLAVPIKRLIGIDGKPLFY